MVMDSSNDGPTCPRKIWPALLREQFAHPVAEVAAFKKACRGANGKQMDGTFAPPPYCGPLFVRDSALRLLLPSIFEPDASYGVQSGSGESFERHP